MCSYLHRAPNGRYYFRMAIPAKLRPFFKGKREIKHALRTADRETAKGLIPDYTKGARALLDHAQAALDAASQPKPKAYSPSREEWEHMEAQARHDEQAEMELEALEPVMDAIERGAIPLASVAEVARAGQLLARHERQMAAIKLDELAHRLNPPKAEPAEKQKTTDATSIKGLYERYAESGTANPKTVARWRSRVADLVKFLGHDDVTKVTRADLNRWVASLVAKPVAGKTIRDGYLPAIRAALNLAYDDELISSNPADGLKVRAPKPVQLRERDLTDEEATTILAATMQPQPKGLAAEHALARRWVPWLCAYTGARVGEITQLRACDIQQKGETWLIHITPEAGSVKTGKARTVPLHSHLIEQGFTALAKAGDKTPLFYRDGAGNEINPPYKIRAADLAKWVRKLGIKAPQPNHGWRHRFKTMARLYGIPEATADAIQGHAAASEGRKYGSVPLPVLKEAIEKLPRYQVKP